jgi:Uma2 family endonuclease
MTMSTIETTGPITGSMDPMWVPSPLYRMTVEEYETMVASGAFKGRRRFHLINGLMVEKMTQNPPHTMADELCGRELLRIMPPRWHLRTSKPIRLPAQGSKPEPDRCIVRGDLRDYRQDPGPGDIALVVEVSDSTLADDRYYVSRLYGPAGIPVCWIVNLVDRQVEVYTDPGPAGYATRADFRPGQSVPVVIDGQPVGQIAVDDMLP